MPHFWWIISTYEKAAGSSIQVKLDTSNFITKALEIKYVVVWKHVFNHNKTCPKML